MIRKYVDSDNKTRTYGMVPNFIIYTSIDSKQKSDSLNLISGDSYDYFLTVKIDDKWSVTYSIEDVIVPDIATPTPDPGDGTIFAVTSGGDGFVVSIQLQEYIDQALYQYSTRPDVDGNGNFTYRPVERTLTRSVFEPDDTKVTLTGTHYATPGEVYYVKYRSKTFPNNISPFSETLSLTVAAASKPEIGRLRAFDESDSQIRLTVNSDNASADNQQTLTIKRSLDGIDFVDIHTELVSSTGTITIHDDTVAYPSEYHYQAVLSSTGGADVSNIVTETPTAPPAPTTPTVSYSLTNQDERRGIEYAAVLCTIIKTSPGVYAESYEVLVEPRNSDDVTLTTGSITNQGDSTTRTTSTYRDDVDSYVRVSVRAKRTLDGVYSAWSSRVINYINA